MFEKKLLPFRFANQILVKMRQGWDPSRKNSDVFCYLLSSRGPESVTALEYVNYL